MIALNIFLMTIYGISGWLIGNNSKNVLPLLGVILMVTAAMYNESLLKSEIRDLKSTRSAEKCL